MGARTAGFTLIEVTVALAIVAAVAIAALGQSAAASRASVDAAETVTGAALAEQRIETLRAMETRELLPLPDSLARGRFDAPLDGYEWEARVERLPHEPSLLAVKVTVTWPDGSFPLETRWYRP